MKILLIQTAFLGDLVLTTAIIEKLHTFYPKAELHFLIRKGNESLVENHPYLHKILIWDKQKNKLRNGFKILKTIRAEKYDKVINSHRFVTSGIFTAFSGAKYTVGYDKNPLSFLFTKKIKHFFGPENAPKHEVTRLLELINDLTDDAFVMPKLHPSAENIQKVTDLITPIGLNFICIAPSTVWFTKRLPTEKWIQILQKTPSETTIFLIGAKSDFDYCNEIQMAANHPKCFNLCGKMALLESAALMQRARMNHVNDSSPLHISSAMNAPVTVYFCSTSRILGFTPLSDVSFIVESKQPMPCRPCGLHGHHKCPKGHFKCGLTIEV
jgi:ADP-heptose:LPS heptosyltransferase